MFIKPICGTNRRNAIFYNHNLHSIAVCIPGRLVAISINLRIPTGIGCNHFIVITIQISHTVRAEHQCTVFIQCRNRIRIIPHITISTTAAGIGGITLCIMCRFCHHSNIIMVQRITLCLATGNTGLRLHAGSLRPIMPQRNALSSATSQANFRLCAGRLSPAMSIWQRNVLLTAQFHTANLTVDHHIVRAVFQATDWLDPIFHAFHALNVLSQSTLRYAASITGLQRQTGCIQPIMPQRIAISLTASKASFRLCAGCICPVMTLGQRNDLLSLQFYAASLTVDHHIVRAVCQATDWLDPIFHAFHALNVLSQSTLRYAASITGLQRQTGCIQPIMPQRIHIAALIAVVTHFAGVNGVALLGTGRLHRIAHITVSLGIYRPRFIVITTDAVAFFLTLLGAGRLTDSFPAAIAVSKGIAGAFAAAVTNLRLCAGSIGIIMAKCRHNIRPILIATPAAGIGCVTLLGAGRFGHFRDIVMPQRSAVLCSANGASLSGGAGSFRPTMTQGCAFCGAASFTGLCVDTSSFDPIVAQRRCFSIRITVAAAAGMGGVALFRTSGSCHNRRIAMDMIQRRNDLRHRISAVFACKQFFAVCIFRSFPDHNTVIPDMPQRRTVDMATCSTGLRCRAGGIGIPVTKRIHIVRNMGIFTSGAGICGITLRCASRRGDDLAIVMTECRSILCAASRTSFGHRTGCICPLMAICHAIRSAASLTCLGGHASCCFPIMAQRRLFTVSVAVATTAGMGSIALLCTSGICHHNIRVCMRMVERRNDLCLRLTTNCSGIQNLTIYFFGRLFQNNAIIPSMCKQLPFRCAANGTSFGIGASRVLPGVAQGFTFRCATFRTGLGRCAGSVVPSMHMRRLSRNCRFRRLHRFRWIRRFCRRNGRNCWIRRLRRFRRYHGCYSRRCSGIFLLLHVCNYTHAPNHAEHANENCNADQPNLDLLPFFHIIAE